MTPGFPFHIEVVERQIERWVQEFNLDLMDAYLCSINLPRETKNMWRGTDFPTLKYTIVLIALEFPESFKDIILRREGPWWDDDFFTVYAQQPPPRHWPAEWSVAMYDETFIPTEDNCSFVEFDKIKIRLMNRPDASLVNVFRDAKRLWREVLRIRKENRDATESQMKRCLITALKDMPDMSIERSYLDIKGLMRQAISDKGRQAETFIMTIVSEYAVRNVIQIDGDIRKAYGNLTRLTSHDMS